MEKTKEKEKGLWKRRLEVMTPEGKVKAIQVWLREKVHRLDRLTKAEAELREDIAEMKKVLWENWEIYRRMVDLHYTITGKDPTVRTEILEGEE